MYVKKLYTSKHWISNQQGYLMVDALIAIVIVVTFFAAIASMTTVSGRFIGIADDRSKAYSYAQERMEQLKQPTDRDWQKLIPKDNAIEVNIEDLPNYVSLATTFQDPEANKTFTVSIGNTDVPKAFTRKTFVRIPNNNTGSNLVQVRVEVQWTDSAKQLQRISVTNFYERLSG